MTRGRQFRKSRQFEIKPKFLIAGDGKNEENYFDGLTCGNPDILIKAVGLGKTGIRVIITKTWSMMKDYEIDPRHGDRVAIVTDLDLRYTPEQVDDMKCECERLGIELYVSNPCFEVWLLEHFIEFRKPSNPKDLIPYMNEVLGKRYDKAELLNWDRELVSRALTNAERLFGKDCDVVWCAEHNPSTNVHVLVKDLIDDRCV